MKNKRLIDSFKHAKDGIKTGVKQERNMKIQFTIMILVIILGFILKISATEWIICIILFGLVISLELVNTAIETTVDLVTNEVKDLAKIAKDTAAGAVLVAAILATIIGMIIFLPKVMTILEVI